LHQRQETFRWRGLLGALLAMAGILIIFWEEVRTKIPLVLKLVLTLLKLWSASSVAYAFVLFPFVSLTASA
jgi:drug/metabolite transporter (DMT)-like permease